MYISRETAQEIVEEIGGEIGDTSILWMSGDIS